MNEWEEIAAERAEYQREAQAELDAGCLRCLHGSAVAFDHDADCPSRAVPMSELAYMDLGSTIGIEGDDAP